MEIFFGVVVGIAAGAIARSVMPGPRAGGILVAIGVGIAGALIGGVIGAASDVSTSDGFAVGTLLSGVFGALILLFCYRCYAMRAISG